MCIENGSASHAGWCMAAARIARQMHHCHEASGRCTSHHTVCGRVPVHCGWIGFTPPCRLMLLLPAHRRAPPTRTGSRQLHMLPHRAPCARAVHAEPASITHGGMCVVAVAAHGGRAVARAARTTVWQVAGRYSPGPVRQAQAVPPRYRLLCQPQSRRARTSAGLQGVPAGIGRGASCGSQPTPHHGIPPAH